MLASARKKVILVEPVKNSVNSSNWILSAFARKAGQIGNDEIAYRFDLDDLRLWRICIPIRSRYGCSVRSSLHFVLV